MRRSNTRSREGRSLRREGFRGALRVELKEREKRRRENRAERVKKSLVPKGFGVSARDWEEEGICK